MVCGEGREGGRGESGPNRDQQVVTWVQKVITEDQKVVTRGQTDCCKLGHHDHHFFVFIYHILAPVRHFVVHIYHFLVTKRGPKVVNTI